MLSEPTLRFMSGDRAGESVPLTGPTFTIGRRPGNSLQINDASISGRHAELTIDDLGVSLRDLSSTNGTRVDGVPAMDERLGSTALIRFGSVEVRFEDGSGPAGAALSGALEGSAAHMGQIASDRLDRSSKVSKLLPLLVLLMGAGAAAAWYLLPSEDQDTGGGRKTTAVVDVTGNLLGGSYSFEAAGEDWAPPGETPAVFSRTTGARKTGRWGLRAELEDGSGVHQSQLLKVTEGDLVLRSNLRVSGAGKVRMGLHLNSRAHESDPTSNAPAPMTIWGDWCGALDWFDAKLSAQVPPTYDRARVLLEARATGSGTADVDNVSLVADGRGQPLLPMDTFALIGGGEPVSHVTLVNVQEVLLSGLMVESDQPRALSVESHPKGCRVSITDGQSGRVSLRVAPELASTGLRILADSGSRRHPTAFEENLVNSVLIGTGLKMVALDFSAALNVEGVPSSRGGWRLALDLPANGSVVLQVGFREELAAALELASRARQAARAGSLGEAIQLWQELLDAHPFDVQVTSEAQAAIASLVHGARIELGLLEKDVERARFFRLSEGYREALDAADRLAARYQGTDSASQAKQLVASIGEELDILIGELEQYEIQRLEAIREALLASDSQLLAQAVSRMLQVKRGGGR